MNMGALCNRITIVARPSNQGIFTFDDAVAWTTELLLELRGLVGREFHRERTRDAEG